MGDSAYVLLPQAPQRPSEPFAPVRVQIFGVRLFDRADPLAWSVCGIGGWAALRVRTCCSPNCFTSGLNVALNHAIAVLAVAVVILNVIITALAPAAGNSSN